MKDNIGHWRTSEDVDEWEMVSVRDESYRSETPLTDLGTVLSVWHTRDSIPRQVGAGAAMLPSRLDSIDRMTITDYLDTTGSFIDHPAQIWPSWPDMQFEGGTPYPDSDDDGIDDSWEQGYGGDLDRFGFDVDKDGRYDNLECFLHERAGDTVYTATPTQTVSGHIRDHLFEAGTTGYELFDMQGRLVFCLNASETRGLLQTAEILQNSISSGLFLLRVRKGGRIRSVRLVTGKFFQNTENRER